MDESPDLSGKLPDLPDLFLDGLRKSVELGVGADELTALTMVIIGARQIPDCYRSKKGMGRIARAIVAMEGDVIYLEDQRKMRVRVKKVMAKQKKAKGK